ncbi:AraC family transcriptional regulator [Streptomyces sp. NPDC053079]|uniref:AraC family transcriptional regulator n=1 Tax=Streptomyces sp. NPDC053079 TaxID=3365697 RepID=UPI0037D24AF2
MDVLSDIMAALRTGRPHSAFSEWRGRWRTDIGSYTGAGFHIVLEGTCRLVPAAGGESFELAAGDAVFLPHGTAHTLIGDSPGPIVMLCGAYHLDRSRAHPLLGDFPEVVHLPTRGGRHPALGAVVALFGDELRTPGPGTDAALPALLELLLVHLMRAWFVERTDRHISTGWCGALADPAIGPALRALHGEPSRPWTVADLAVRAGLSRAAFARRFSALVGRPPLAYLTWWRLTLAARLLRESDAPLAAIAQRIGYTSQFAFAHAFKRAYGVSAGRYRKERHDEHEPLGAWEMTTVTAGTAAL